ncbi:MAG: hypothetical protein JJU00_17670 [Opitutales bacterium]|nr:hypothetical protein [Opitutales bacterium]
MNPVHPRLFFGPEDIPALRERAQREPFASMIAAIELAKTYDSGENPSYMIGWQLRNHAFLYVLTGDPALATLRGFGVDTRFVHRTKEGRFGLYFVKTDANQRPGRVVYDRGHASTNLVPFADYDFAGAFADAGWFHFTGMGITAALSQEAANTTLAAAKEAMRRGLTVSCDLNFRKTLWKWGGGRTVRELAAEVMSGLLPFVDVLIANEADAEDVLGICAGESRVEAGELDLSGYPAVARSIVKRFPNIRLVAHYPARKHQRLAQQLGRYALRCGHRHGLFRPNGRRQTRAGFLRSLVGFRRFSRGPSMKPVFLDARPFSVKVHV